MLLGNTAVFRSETKDFSDLLLADDSKGDLEGRPFKMNVLVQTKQNEMQRRLKVNLRKGSCKVPVGG